MGSHQSHGKGENIWLTPPGIVEACGPFDLDPCFSEPRPWSTAATHYGPDAAGGLGGLHADWFGVVWCNPPYDDKAGSWLAKCADHGSAVALTFARTETDAFVREVWYKADGLLFLAGRLFFHRADGTRAKHNSGAPSVLIAYGNDACGRVRNSGLRGQWIDMRTHR